MAPLQGYQVVATEWAMVVMTAVFVGLRLYIRVFTRGRRWPFAEYFVIIAWLSFVVQAGMDTALLYEHFYGETWVNLSVRGYKILYVENALYMFCMYAIKAAMLCFYVELIPRIMRKTWITMWITIFLVAVGCVMSLAANLFACLPVSSNWDTDPDKNCSANDTPVGGFINLIFHLLTDILIYIIPFSILRHLRNIPRRQKIGVGITFGLGFLCIVMAVMVFSAEYIYENPAFVWFWCVWEQTWSITVVCCPAFKALLTKRDRLSKMLSPKALSQFGSEESNGTLQTIGGTPMTAGAGAKKDLISAGTSISGKNTAAGRGTRGSYRVSVDVGTGKGATQLNPIRTDAEQLGLGESSRWWMSRQEDGRLSEEAGDDQEPRRSSDALAERGRLP